MSECISASKQSKLQLLRGTAKDARTYLDRRNGIVVSDGFQGIAVDELLNLGTQILDCSNVIQAYDLLAGKPESGDGNYYDRLIAEPQHVKSYRGFDRVVQWREHDRVERAIDFASGTGTLALILGQVADHVVACDLSVGLLQEAHEKLSRTSFINTFEVVKMDALEYNIPPNKRFDIASSNAFTHYLTYEQQVKFYEGLRYILKPGGRYYEPQQEREEISDYYNSSPMGYMAYQITDIILSLRNQQFGKKLPDPEQLGFKVSGFVYSQTPFIRQVMQLVNP